MKSSTKRETPLAALFLLPSLAIFAVFVFYPLGRTIWQGMYDSDPSSFDSRLIWVGPKQYSTIATSPGFRHSLWVTVQFTLLTVPVGLVLGLLLAVVAHAKLRAMGVFRVIFSSTVATSVAVASLMWLVLLNPSIGVLTRVLPFDSLKTPGLLQRPSTALLAISLSVVWQNLGFTFIVLTAGLQGISEDLYESAELDGASPWRRLVDVTVPMLGPTLLFAMVVLTIGAFQAFGQIDLLTGGGPSGHTMTLAYYIYGGRSPINNNEGAQAATAALLFVILLVLSFVQVRGIDKRVHYA